MVTSLIRRPATSGPAGAVRVAGVRRRGEVRCGGGAVVVVVVAAGGVGADAVLVVGCVAEVVDCVAVVVDCVVVVDCEEVVVDRAPPEPADRCEPV